MPKTSQSHNEEAEPRREETPLESLASICTVLVAGLFILSFVFQNFEIPSASMVKTLLIGDHVMVDRITIAPPTHWMPFVHYRAVRRGDIIVFYKPSPEPDGEYIPLVKRTVGIPGDRIHLRGAILYVNGVAQNEPYVSMPIDDGNPNHLYDPYRDDFPAVPTSMGHDNVTASWAFDLPNHIQGDDLVVPPGMSSPWATTASTRSTAATGASFRMRTSSAARSSSTVVQNPGRPALQDQHRRPHQLHLPCGHPLLRRHTLKRTLHLIK